MATIKSYSDLEQSRKLAEILPLESADMVLPFRHTKKDEYIPGYVVSRNYVEVYNEMIKLPGMEKEDSCKLIQPCWSLAALLGVLPILDNRSPVIAKTFDGKYRVVYHSTAYEKAILTSDYDNPLDACVNMIEKLHELNLL